ncbi:MAG: tetratricopeptide repeat protein [Thermoanaerobaculia bacterium]
MHFRVLGIVAAVAIAVAGGARAGEARAVCGGVPSVYAAALCYYYQGDLPQAAAAFLAIVEEDRPHPETLRSRYFLARTWMKQGRWEEASEELIKIYSLSPSFYEEWSCDFLLGETRRALGLD